ncbi:MAG: mechanosensitive ion channel [Ignavibacteriae bacterium]|nr:mechanosensitive ion channel [Ignavibacteriota bacterium]MCB9242420.1 mechanosensitive ion channel [Ignavibacteriales bacterium]
MFYLDDLFDRWLDNWLLSIGVPADVEVYLALLINFVFLGIICFIFYFLTVKLFRRILKSISGKTKNLWDDAFFSAKVYKPLAHIIPALIISYSIPFIFDDLPDVIPAFQKMADIYIVIAVLTSINGVIIPLQKLASRGEVFKHKPLDGYFQTLRVVFYITAGIIILAILLDESPVYFLTAFGAFSAIILLIFKDTILGIVAVLQISANDLIRIGDWIEMPSVGADGVVKDISIGTVKVRNFDNTFVTVPTYKLVSESFKNWRGMAEAGGRRLKRAVKINLHSIKICDNEMLKKYYDVHYMKDYIDKRKAEIEAFNSSEGGVPEPIKGVHITNLELLRHYMNSYLCNHEHIQKNLIHTVRQLPPEGNAMPVELYAFTNTTDWVTYEEIQADVFNHVLFAAKNFDLEIS